MYRHLLIFAIAATSVGCLTKPYNKCTDNPAYPGCTAIAVDAGMDAAMPQPCGGTCSGSKPICDTATNVCVACLETSQCTDATKSVCDTATNTCVACTDNAQCAHIAGKGVCSAGTCVQCTEATEAQVCGTFVCDYASKTCTQTTRGTVAFCNECTSDSECANNAEGTRRCVPMNYNGAARSDGKKFCLIDKSTLAVSAGGICPQQMYDSVNATSVGGVNATYCSPIQSITTCEATLDFRKSGGCANASACGANLTPTDGMCENDGNGKQCTYRCGGDDDCAAGFKCRTGVTTRYCCTASSGAGCT